MNVNDDLSAATVVTINDLRKSLEIQRHVDTCGVCMLKTSRTFYGSCLVYLDLIKEI